MPPPRHPKTIPASCASCLGWGMMFCRGLCKACYDFASAYKTVDRCAGCARRQPLKQGYCRLCWCQAYHDRSLTATDAYSKVMLAPYLPRIRYHQLFLANVPFRGERERSRSFPRRVGAKGRPLKPPPPPAGRPVSGWVQPPLFEALGRDYTRRHFDLRRDPPPDNSWLAWALYLAHGLAEGRGWHPTTRRAMQRTLTYLLATHTEPETIRATDVRPVADWHNVSLDNTIEILDAMDILTDDRPRTFDLWLRTTLAAMPPGIARHVADWATALRDGGPRSRPRAPGTATAYLHAILPALRDWSARYDHLRQVTREDIRAHLAELHGRKRSNAVNALRSLFAWAKRAKVVFVNPTARLKGPHRDDPILQPLAPDQLAGTVEAATTALGRLLVALAAIHAARSGQIRALRLDNVDLGNRRITIGGHERPLDDLTYQAIRAWLDHRRQRWPGTANPHLVISNHTAIGLGQVSQSLLAPPLSGVPTTNERLRIDRQLDEAIATGGDPLHLAAVFGTGDTTALRWATNARALLGEPHQTHPPNPPGTEVSRCDDEAMRPFGSP